MADVIRSMRRSQRHQIQGRFFLLQTLKEDKKTSLSRSSFYFFLNYLFKNGQTEENILFVLFGARSLFFDLKVFEILVDFGIVIRGSVIFPLVFLTRGR